MQGIPGTKVCHFIFRALKMWPDSPRCTRLYGQEGTESTSEGRLSYVTSSKAPVPLLIGINAAFPTGEGVHQNLYQKQTNKTSPPKKGEHMLRNPPGEQLVKNGLGIKTGFCREEINMAKKHPRKCLPITLSNEGNTN